MVSLVNKNLFIILLQGKDEKGQRGGGGGGGMPTFSLLHGTCVNPVDWATCYRH